MPNRFKLAAGALDDIESIWKFISKDSFDAANRVESVIMTACKAIASRPHMGARRTDLTSANVRFMPVSRYPNYIIVYMPDARPVLILAVIHGNRDMNAALKRLRL